MIVAIGDDSDWMDVYNARLLTHGGRRHFEILGDGSLLIDFETGEHLDV